MIDASIPLKLTNIDIQQGIDNFNTARMNRSKLQDMAQERDLRGEQLKGVRLQSAEDARRAHEEETLRGLAQVNDIRTPEGQNQYLKDAGKLGLGHKVGEIASAFAAQQAAQKKAEEETRKATRQEHLDRLDLRARILPNATDETSYQTSLRRLKALGDDLDGLEPEYNADQVKGHIGEVLSHKDRLELEHKADEDKAKADEVIRKKDEDKETNRHNVAMEGIGRTNANKVPAGLQKNAEFNALPVESQEIVKDLSKKNAQKLSIANQIAGDLKQYRAARGLDENGQAIPGAKPDNDRALKIANGMVKTLNSKEGADAVGTEEAGRLATAIQFQTNPLNLKGGQRLGRDFEAFDTQIGDTFNGIMGGIEANKAEIERAYGRKPAGQPPAPNTPPAPAGDKPATVVKWGRDANGKPVPIP